MAKPNYNDEGFKQYLERMKIALVASESGGKNIDNPVPGETATGFYQYNAKHLDSIKAHAKSIGMTINNMQDFKNNPDFQHSYFRADQYKNYIFAKERINNEMGLNIEQLGYLAHWRGQEGAKTVLKNKEFPKKEYKTVDGKTYVKNPDGKVIMDKFTNNLKTNGLYQETAYQKNILRSMNVAVPQEEKKRIQAEYDKEVKRINGLDEEPLMKGQMIQSLNQKYFDEGNLEIINQKTDYRNNNAVQKLKNLRAKNKTFKFNEDGSMEPSLTNEEAVELAELEKKYQTASKTARSRKNNPTIADVDKVYNSMDRTKRIDISKYSKPVEITESEGQQYDEDGNPIESSSESESSSNTKYNEQYPYDGSKKEADAVKKGMTDNEYLASLNGLQSDPKFNYVEGKTQIPLEAGIGLLAGISGMNAANEQPGMRDEEIDESLLQFASMQQKIAKMGLAPEAEAALKNDLASMYQTSHDNMVKASAGNRNLVLGNQGQADQARMEGLSKIALMDLDARQKGMEAYGRVAEYMSSFKAQKDIANNERQYAEFQKRQSAGVAVAEKGFGLLIDSLKTARDTGPGSAHDMYMQKIKFSLTGVNERIPDNGLGDTPMTQSYVDRLATERKEKDASDQSKKDFFWGLPVEKRQAWKDLSEQYPEASLDDLRTKFDSPESVVEKKANETPTLSELNRYVTLTPEQLADERSALENPMPEKGTFSPPGPKRMYNGLSTDEQPEPDLNALEKSNAKQRTETDKEIASYSANLASVSGVSESQIKDEANQQKLKAEELLRQSEENIKRTELATQAILLENEKQGKAIDNVTASARQ